MPSRPGAAQGGPCSDLLVASRSGCSQRTYSQADGRGGGDGNRTATAAVFVCPSRQLFARSVGSAGVK